MMKIRFLYLFTDLGKVDKRDGEVMHSRINYSDGFSGMPVLAFGNIGVMIRWNISRN
jgi:hypothetical protein